jgi:putative phage-type endonuclease
MKLINLEQGSPDWVLWREGGLGASDAPTIMGVDYYGVTREQLLREKITGEKRQSSFSMRRGNRLEPFARELYATQLGYPYKVAPAVIVHPELDWMRASLDGLAENCETGELEWIVEIKCWSWDKHDSVLAGICPEVVFPQIQHQLLCAGLSRCDLVSYTENAKFSDEDRLAVLRVPAEPEYQQRLLESECAFWSEVLAGREAIAGGVR